MAKTSTTVGLVFATIVTIAIIVTVIIIVIIRLRPPAEDDTDTALDQNDALDGILCTSNSQCASGACNQALGVCVDCLVNEDCGGILPYCRTENNVCVECLEDNECDSPETCVNNECCQDTPPVITGITSNFTSNRGIDISFDIFQPRLKSKILLVIEDPDTGWVLGKGGCVRSTTSECVDTQNCIKPCFEFPGTAPIISLRESNLPFKFYGGFEYRFRMQISYKCGTNDTQITEMSDPFDYIVPLCPDTPVLIPLQITTQLIPTFNEFGQVVFVNSNPFIEILTSNLEANFSCTIIAYDISDLHPALLLAEFNGVTRNGPGIYKVVDIPPPPEPLTGVYYFRIYKNGDTGVCDGDMTNFAGEVSWDFGS